jgi:hypothetical protein
MIQVVVENKYSFSMRVSVKAMAALDRDRSRREVPLVRRLLTSAFNQLGIGLSARLCERLLTEIAHQVDKRPSTNLLCSGVRRTSVARLTGPPIGLLGASAKSADAYQGNMEGACLRSIRRSVRCGKPPQTKVAIVPERWTWCGKPSMKRRRASSSPTSMPVAAANLIDTCRHHRGARRHHDIRSTIE